MNPEQIIETRTVIAVGQGLEVPTALKALHEEINKLTAGREWDMKHFVLFQEMKLVPLQQSAQFTQYAIAIICYKSVGMPVIPQQQQ